MDKAIEKTSHIYDQLNSLTENIVALDKRCKELEKQMNDCDYEIKIAMDDLKQILLGSFKKEETHLLSKSILKRLSKLFEEKSKIDYLISKYCYHRSKAQKRMSLVQEQVRSSSDMLSFSR